MEIGTIDCHSLITQQYHLACCSLLSFSQPYLSLISVGLLLVQGATLEGQPTKVVLLRNMVRITTCSFTPTHHVGRLMYLEELRSIDVGVLS